jgi:peptidoglycan/xylan/chitin deacetylase (PgdA/CDA1 family)
MISALSGDDSQIRDGVFIAFDDGLLNNATEAEPILARHSLTACCFVCPGLSKRGELIWADNIWEGIVDGPTNQIDLTAIGGGIIALPQDKHRRATIAGVVIERMKSISHEERRLWLDILGKQGTLSQTHNSIFALMSLAEIRAMAERGIFEIGSHTMNHPILSSENITQQEEEIGGCRKALEDAGIASSPLFVYPNGRRQDYTDETIAIVRRAGFAGACVSKDGLYDKSADIFQIPRIAIGNDTNIWEFKAKMSGFYYALKRTSD